MLLFMINSYFTDKLSTSSHRITQNFQISFQNFCFHLLQILKLAIQISCPTDFYYMEH